jgi:hypothetical protein
LCENSIQDSFLVKEGKQPLHLGPPSSWDLCLVDLTAYNDQYRVGMASEAQRPSMCSAKGFYPDDSGRLSSSPERHCTLAHRGDWSDIINDVG